ncbi:MAG: hypothetical protein ACFNJR_09125, partial [Segatella oulorum]|uniref:hypothetical protein n=1 Tax=Segatella oulorum TaxID=28136 RepID=UPI003620E532
SSRQHFPKKEEGGGRLMLLVFDEDIDGENPKRWRRHSHGLVGRKISCCAELKIAHYFHDAWHR